MKRFIKSFVIVVGCILFIVVLYFANAFLGNPVSYLLAKNAAKNYMEQQYNETDYEIETVRYDFKTGGYYTRVISPSSQDTYFYLQFSMMGRLEYDSFDEWVSSRRTTWNRIDEEYRELVNKVLEAEDFPYESNIAGGELRGMFDIEEGSLQKDFGLDPATLELDKEYDVKALATKYGSITFYAYDDEVSVEKASEILLEITGILEDKEVPFYAIDFVLQKTRNEDGSMNEDDSYVWLMDFLHSDIHKDGLEERVQKSHEETVHYFEMQDKETEVIVE